MTVEEANDVAILVSALKEVHLIVGQYIEPGPRDAKAAVNELLAALDNTKVYASLKRLEQNEQLQQLR